MVYERLGLAGQQKLAGARVLIVGVGGLGSWIAELLARAGVGMLRLADDDRVELANIHRQGLYDEAASAAGTLKVHAAKQRIAAVNSQVAVECVTQRLDASNARKLADGIDLILDGTDNFASRFIINDLSVATGRPWILGGVVGTEAIIMTIIPGRTSCLRCVFETPPPADQCPTAATHGVLGPAVAATASMQALEAIKVLSGNASTAASGLLKMNLWSGEFRRVGTQRAADCICCSRKHFDFLPVE